MPKRVIDGEGLWRSEKLGRVQPEKYRPEYANQIPLALANGVFECAPRRVWSLVYAFNRPEVSVADVETMLAEFERVGMLFRWATDDKKWGYWVGIERPGRLPPASRLQSRHEPMGPEPPAEALKAYVASHRLANGYSGSGFGFGVGSGSGAGSGLLAIEASPVAPAVDVVKAGANEEIAAVEMTRSCISEIAKMPTAPDQRTRRQFLQEQSRQMQQKFGGKGRGTA